MTRERRERWPRELVDQMRHDTAVLREELQRVVVERRQRVADHRRLSVGDNRGDELVSRHLAVEHVTAPPLGGQRHWHDIRTETRELSTENCLETSRGDLRRVLRIVLEQDARHLVHEPAAIRCRIDPQHLRECGHAAGNGNVV
jgi:hypothetical protein